MSSTPNAPLDSNPPLSSPVGVEMVAVEERRQFEQARAWDALETLLRENFHEPDIEAAKIVLGCTAAHRIMEYPPAWNMAVAVAGSMKTVILEGLDELPDVHLIDEVTPQTFISGKIDSARQSRKRPASILH